MNAYEAMQKRKEKLEKLRAYSAQSTSFFSEYNSSQQELNTAINQVKDCKAWNASTGTFDISKLDMNWAKAISSRWDERAKKMEQEHAAKFKKAMEGRRYVRVQIAPGVYEWMWVKDPLRVSQADFEFNETYKDYLAILMNPKENGILDDYFATMAEELRTGINAKTGKPLTDLEKAQRWSTVLSAISVVAIGAYYGGKGLTSNKKNTPKKTSGTNPTKTDFGAENPVSGKDWNDYFKDKYGAGKVNWKPNSLEDIISNPERLYGSTKNEIKSILGEGWTEASYGSAGTGWKFTNDGDGMVFYHPGDGIHGGSYYGFSTGDTDKVKIVGEDYIDFSNDKATFIKFGGE
ncbi:hypothetical protein [Enterococcus crotali]|uniref:hypothetical protein n=1 Tax=Enterococcus crotali TaxID=1453587 RepID=UPI00046F7B0C|nr:hypothetical protein [Enterococcus crotali]